MFKTLTLAGAAFAIGATALLPAAPAAAQSYERSYGNDGYGYRDGGDRDDRGYRDGRSYRGRDDRRDYRRDRRRGGGCDSTGGTVIGAIAGGLLGNTVAGRGDRTLGTVLGGVGGAFAGRAIDRSDDPSYCRRRR